MKRIVVTGALGQIGTELVEELRRQYGHEQVLATDIREGNQEEGPYKKVDVMNGKQLFDVAQSFQADTMIHMAALLSAKAEEQPLFAWNLNMGGLVNALDVAQTLNMQFFTPSSIGAFGPTTPKVDTPQMTIQRPTTMYGVNKVSGELLCDYYFHKFGVDTRGLRFPGLVSHVAQPGGGTTDYAVDIYYDAIEQGAYTSFLAEGTYLDMMYMPDALQAIIKLMEADGERLQFRNAYNVSAMSVAPETIGEEIRRHIPTFRLDYEVDPVRQAIADSWPDMLDCSAAKTDWGFQPTYDVTTMTKDMLLQLKGKLKACS